MCVSSHSEKNKKKTGFDIENLLLRGCIVRNTAHASGIVVYAGIVLFLITQLLGHTAGYQLMASQ